MNLTEMQNFVRAQADTDATDAPGGNLELYARAAYNDIRRRIAQWVDQYGTDVLSTVADQSGYAQSALTTGNIEYVTQVVGPTRTIPHIPFSTYLEMMDGPDVVTSTVEADFFTVKNGVVYLYPTPSTTGTEYAVHGYTTFDDWPTAGGEPGLPREFDEVICWYMLSKYYLGQEDLELSQNYMQQYEASVNRFIASSIRDASPHPRVLGGAYSRRRTLGYGDWVRRNTQG